VLAACENKEEGFSAQNLEDHSFSYQVDYIAGEGKQCLTKISSIIFGELYG